MTKKEMVTYLLDYLIKENPQFRAIDVPSDLAGQETLLRALLNVRPPMAVSSSFLDMQNNYLQLKKAERVVVFLNHLQPIPTDDRLYVWKGDITRLKVDAIVNAANRRMLGCFQPLHDCADNAIHTYAGVQLRLDCYKLMQEQGHDEPTGTAKITPAYNLPAKFVLHTVSPAINEHLTPIDEDLLAKSYLSCLTLAEKNRLESVALSSLATADDEVHFINENTARIAIQTAKDFLEHSQFVNKIIFNVDEDEELNLYQQLLN
ncbi:protein-ADP-ribose hydrolase [Streptococcus gallolyticus]|uniref:protein-ADP-ribose hydrolase n=1 Tax=Streptococcus gallolyticus TaxID=315405 RepID=UPI0022B726AF|nr:protein-ADP-ribose hydrolase [Streptococcus gallolyticus]WAW99900.1 protein-ADP-ribose hydrolase [Streptococcus gallolyticus]